MMSRQHQEMIGLAEHYCQLIDASSEEHPTWLHEVAEILPRLQVFVVSLDGVDLGDGHYLSPDLDARFELFSHLHELLGERDGYWQEFDSAGDSDLMTGSLADDLTDIYCELKHGLRVAGVYPERAIKGWRDGFECHWGQHLLDAQRHLSTLAAQHRLAY